MGAPGHPLDQGASDSAGGIVRIVERPAGRVLHAGGGVGALRHGGPGIPRHGRSLARVPCDRSSRCLSGRAHETRGCLRILGECRVRHARPKRQCGGDDPESQVHSPSPLRTDR